MSVVPLDNRVAWPGLYNIVSRRESRRIMRLAEDNYAYVAPVL
jgi:hypothetical protein